MLLEAVVAVNGPALSRLEGHLRRDAAGSADRWMHGPGLVGAGISYASAADGAAGCAARGLVEQSPALVKLLFPGAKGKGIATLSAHQGFVLESHWKTSGNQVFAGAFNALFDSVG